MDGRRQKKEELQNDEKKTTKGLLTYFVNAIFGKYARVLT